ncbi:molecule interacting with CasL isoform X4 [Rhynchophorus ferrugineus]|uniref:molecule interacting with CasL isoform X4 n=1 Tax=Rhynchophorus ferrugineus TaxID=354439 RepID=UPI003FCC648B
MDRHSGAGPPQHMRGRPVSGKDVANANEYFEPFLNATTMKNILGYHRSMCEFLHLKPNVFPHFYPKLKSNLNSWRAKAVWKKFDLRASHKCYNKGKACAGTKVLVIGAGPCGLRTAIEAQLLGAKVVIVEKRDRLSRNNVLHLWPFVIEDLRMLGAKKFFGKFCAGAIDHISIRQLQCILLKVALLLGVEVHTEVSFVNLVEPSADQKTGWRAEVKPEDHPVAQYEFDVIIGADGKRNTLQGFKRKEFRGKLAIAITANFINKKTEAEARVEEISGVAFIFNQKFFKDLQDATRIDLENIVYYKDDTHYFVMTAKKASLLEKEVIKQDLADTEKLLAPDNVNRDKLYEYAREAAEFSTNYQMTDLEFAVNHYGQPDVAMFDFTSMYAAEYASKVVERNGSRLLMILVGDSLLEPFWPTGSGCARGFLSSLDAAWAIRSWSSGQYTPLDVLAERESIYRLLAQTTPDNLNKDWKAYTLDPSTRYPNLNKTVVVPHQTECLYDTDNKESVEKMKRASLNANIKHEHVSKKRRRGGVDNEVLLSWLTEQLRDHEDVIVTDIASVFQGGRALCAIIHHYRPDLLDYNAVKDNEPGKCNQLAMDILEKDLAIPPFMTGEEITSTQDNLAMTTYLTQVYYTFRGEIPHIKHPKLELPEATKHSSFSIKSIKVAHQQQSTNNLPVSRPSSRHKRHADMSMQKAGSMERKQRKRRTLDRFVPSVDYETKSGLKPLTNTNADEDIASKIKSLEDKWSNPQPAEKKPKDLLRAIGKIETSDWNIKQIEKKILENKLGKPSSVIDKERVPRWSKEEFKARQTKMENKHLDRQDSSEAKFADIDKNIKQLDLKLKEGNIRELGQNKVASITEKLVSKTPQEQIKTAEKPAQPKTVNLPSGSEFCHFCDKKVYLMERLSAEGRFFHNGCFKCQYCHTQLRLGSYMFDKDGQYGHRFFCSQHYGMPGELPKPTKITRKASLRGSRDVSRSPSKRLPGVAGVDLLDRVQTPERIEFSNLSAENISSDQEEPLSQMDEDEWTDKNFGASCNELDESDDDSSSSFSSDSDDEDVFDDALEQPATKEGTLKLAERWKKCYRKGMHSDSDGYSSSDHSSYYENSSDDSDSETATEGEEEIRARELRKQEVRVEPPVVQTDTGTDTEMVSDESSSETSSEIQNSATEISTDSEFAHDEPTPTRELPAIALNDVHVTKTRGSGAVVDPPRRIQVTSGFLQGPVGTAPHHAQFLLKPAPYALNRTQSTGGIATKVSLELKRRYLLGEGEANSIQKSGSASALDSKFKSFQSTISDCQRMLKPAVEPSASMQLFCSKLDERLSPSGPPPSLPPPDITITTITEQSSLSGDGAKQPNNSNERIDTVPMGDEQEQSTESSSSSEEAATTPNFRFESIPRVEVHAAKDSDAEEMALDSLCGPSPAPDQIKSVGSEKKELNQPKPLPNLEHILPDIHKVLHVRIKSDKEESPEDNKSIKTVSGKSSPDGTAALTETELSDWARDENVSDSIELDISQGSDKKKLINLAKLSEFEEAVNEYICPKDTTDANKKSILANDNDLDSIEYMDTGTETSSEDGIGNSQDGYVLFKNEDDLVDDSLNPQVNEILEARNIYLISTEKEQQHHQADLKKSSDLDSNVEAQNKQKPTTTEHEEDSLVVVDTGTTTEENTCSDSTVKNITEITKDMKEEKSRPSLKIEQFQKQRLEDKLAKVKAEQALIKDQMQQSNQKENIEHNIQFEEHCQRLQSKVEFGNAKDSIDIRKSRRKSKSDSPHKPDLIREEKERPSPPKDITLNLNPVIRPDILYKKENIKKERDVNQKLIQEMVMNKMKAENKSLERRRRSRGNLGSLSPCRPYPIQKSSTTDVVSQTNLSNVSKNDSIASSTYATPDLLSNSMALKHSQSTDTVPGINSSNENYETPMASTPPKQNISKPLSVFSETRRKNETPLTTTDNYSMPDIRKQLFLDEFKTPKAPPRYNRPSIIRTAEKMKEDARARVRLLSNEDLGLSPEDKLNKLRERVGKKSNRASDDLDIHVQESIESLVLNTERRNSLLYPNDTLTKKRNNSFRRSMSGDSAMPTKDLSVSECRPKSISGIPKNLSLSKSNNIETDTKKACKSDPNLLDTHGTKKKSKDRERRKSITKLIAGIFAKKTPSANSTTTKGLFAKLSPKSKTTSKETPIEESTRRKSLSENNIQKRDPSPPPIPPLPVNYSVKATDESSDGDNVDCKHAEQGSCDTLDQSVNLETSISSMTSSRRSLKARKISRQAQLKRHRMAQEIQRKLEETEVKTRELEQRGVHVEKSLRGENGSTSKDESELLQEWFDLMRDKTELRRYEKELMVRAKELELEDRHARLQAELRERLENNDNKTEDDVKLEKNIIKEMMDIVSERDSLITVLEEDRQRYTNEDKDLEEQMLAKGLRLTPIQKSTEK